MLRGGRAPRLLVVAGCLGGVLSADIDRGEKKKKDENICGKG